MRRLIKLQKMQPFLIRWEESKNLINSSGTVPLSTKVPDLKKFNQKYKRNHESQNNLKETVESVDIPLRELYIKVEKRESQYDSLFNPESAFLDSESTVSEKEIEKQECLENEKEYIGKFLKNDNLVKGHPKKGRKMKHIEQTYQSRKN
ncbi:hypothetical protein JTB14_038410 [Gonioctena quinquepunctata]|nr:hypothetical protein JTB14_038410 [Gonioctena quinquepunctata]